MSERRQDCSRCDSIHCDETASIITGIDDFDNMGRIITKALRENFGWRGEAMDESGLRVRYLCPSCSKTQSACPFDGCDDHKNCMICLVEETMKMADWRWLEDSAAPIGEIAYGLWESADGSRKSKLTLCAYDTLKLFVEWDADTCTVLTHPPNNMKLIAWQPMIPPAPPVEDITPEQVTRYLEEHGWVLKDRNAEFSRRWSKGREMEWQPWAEARNYERELTTLAANLAYLDDSLGCAEMILTDMAMAAKGGITCLRF